jgi:methyl-accepting chemotaxis protein
LKEAERRLSTASQAVDRANQAAANADAALGRIQSAETDVVEPAKLRMERLAESINDALRNVQTYFDKIDDF